MLNDKLTITQKKTIDTAVSDSARAGPNAVSLIDNRPQFAIQLKLQESISSSQLIQKKTNNTGLPDNLKSGIENLSGYSMNDVKVHYNSSKPAQLNAHAYAQGADIHVASGQEKHLAHEAWHVVQQKQGRVKPTMQMKGKVNVNDDTGLEKEADIMGSKAAAMQLKYNPVHSTFQAPVKSFYTSSYSTVQRATANWVNPAAVGALSGSRAAAGVGPNAGHAAKAGAKDYIKGTHYDGPHHTPVYELISQLNNHYEGKNTGLAAPNDKVPKLTANKVWLSSPLNATYHRPFEVKARTSVPRGKGRSNKMGIETNIGYMGSDEASLHGKFGFFNGGHLVGDQMMDSHGSFLLYEDWNLAPQRASFNSPIYLTTMENAATAAINAGADIEYTVNLGYAANRYNLQASALVKNIGWSGGFGGVKTYGQLLDAAIKNGEPDQAITFTTRIPGYWRAHMKDLNAGQNINSVARDDFAGIGAYDGTMAAVGPAANYAPAGWLESFRYTAEADGVVLGPLAAGKQWDIQAADELTLTTRQETY